LGRQLLPTALQAWSSVIITKSRLELRPPVAWRYSPPHLVSHASRGYASRLILRVWPICTIRPPHDFGSLPEPGRVGASVMGLDAGTVLKRSVLCPHCNEDYLFTLRAIADNPELRCHGCGGSIRLSDRVYQPLLSDVGNALDEIDSAPPSFISAHYRPAV
jgi:hypothetical protein